jgi:hypothetical protein
MKKRTTITTEKREIWIISEGGPQSHIPGPVAPTDRAEGISDTALVTTETSTTTKETDDSEKK